MKRLVIVFLIVVTSAGMMLTSCTGVDSEDSTPDTSTTTSSVTVDPTTEPTTIITTPAPTETEPDATPTEQVACYTISLILWHVKRVQRKRSTKKWSRSQILFLSVLHLRMTRRSSLRTLFPMVRTANIPPISRIAFCVSISAWSRHMNEWAILTRIGDDNPTNRLSRRDNLYTMYMFRIYIFR
jgi:hypothetical protein